MRRKLFYRASRYYDWNKQVANYERYIISFKWKIVHKRWVQTFKTKYGCSPKCYCCNEKYNDIHHVTYERLGKEKFEDLIPICRSCHEILHSWIDSNFLIRNNLKNDPWYTTKRLIITMREQQIKISQMNKKFT